MLTFIFGALAGGLAATYWLGELGNIGSRRLRNQAADKVDAAERALVRMVQNASTQARARLRPEPAHKGNANC